MAAKFLRRIFGLGGWLIAAPVAVLLAFAVLNLALTTFFFMREGQGGRLIADVRSLALSGVHDDADTVRRRYAELYASRIGRKPQPTAIQQYLESQLTRQGPAVLDQVLVDYIRLRWGAIDGRTLPPGVYVGARAIGPDTPPLSPVTKYLAQYGLYPRHGYVLVVPAPQQGVGPIEFSASRVSDFIQGASDPHALMIRPEPFQFGAYDFPGPGQGVHELFRLSADPQTIRKSIGELTRLSGELRTTGARYELFRQNSNTVLGCMLRASALHRRSFEPLRHDPLISLRLMGISRSLWSQPLRKPANVQCS